MAANNMIEKTRIAHIMNDAISQGTEFVLNPLGIGGLLTKQKREQVKRDLNNKLYNQLLHERSEIYQDAFSNNSITRHNALNKLYQRIDDPKIDESVRLF